MRLLSALRAFAVNVPRDLLDVQSGTDVDPWIDEREDLGGQEL